MLEKIGVKSLDDLYQEIPEEGLVWLRRQEGIRKVTYLSLR